MELTASKIWRLAGKPDNFKDWLTKEQELYQSRLESNSIKGDRSFIQWLNMRYRYKAMKDGKSLNAEGKSTVGDAVKNIFDKTTKILQGSESPGAVESIPTIEGKKTILGMKPAVFWVVTGSLVIVGSVAVYTMIKKRK